MSMSWADMSEHEFPSTEPAELGPWTTVGKNGKKDKSKHGKEKGRDKDSPVAPERHVPVGDTKKDDSGWTTVINRSNTKGANFGSTTEIKKNRSNVDNHIAEPEQDSAGPVETEYQERIRILTTMGVEEDKAKFAVEQTKSEVRSAWCNAALDLLYATPSAVDEPVHLARTATESAAAEGGWIGSTVEHDGTVEKAAAGKAAEPEPEAIPQHRTSWADRDRLAAVKTARRKAESREGATPSAVDEPVYLARTATESAVAEGGWTGSTVPPEHDAEEKAVVDKREAAFAYARQMAEQVARAAIAQDRAKAATRYLVLRRRGGMQIQVRRRPLKEGRRLLVRGKTFTLDVAASDSVASVKARIHGKEGIPPEEQCLVFRGKLLQDERTLQDYCVFKDAELELLGRVPGGVNPAAGAGLNAARGTSTVTAPEGAPPANRPQRQGSGPEMPAAAAGEVPAK